MLIVGGILIGDQGPPNNGFANLGNDIAGLTLLSVGGAAALSSIVLCIVGNWGHAWHEVDPHEMTRVIGS